jgi:hypothetical protein
MPSRRLTKSIAFVFGIAGIAYAGFTFSAQTAFPGVVAAVPA